MTVTRGTSNSNQRGSAATRRARKEWLINTYRADVDVMMCVSKIPDPFDEPEVRMFEWPKDLDLPVGLLWEYTRHKACRCYRCGNLLIVDTVTVDRIVPGRDGGTYKRNNIRPACGFCNSSTGSLLARRGKAKR